MRGDDETPKITERQRGLLLVLPDQPGDGKLCKGPKLRIAENLERLGYAQRVGSGFFNGGKFTRTAAGRAKLVELGDLVGLPGLRRAERSAVSLQETERRTMVESLDIRMCGQVVVRVEEDG